MTEKQELQAVQALADCFYFFKRKIMPDMQNAPQHYIALAQMCEMGLNALGASIEQESVLGGLIDGDIVVKYKGKTIEPEIKFDLSWMKKS